MPKIMKTFGSYSSDGCQWDYSSAKTSPCRQIKMEDHDKQWTYHRCWWR